jgi:hypothetical protein
MACVDVPVDQLNTWWDENQAKLAKNPGDLNAIRQQVLLGNEYNRQGIPVPRAKFVGSQPTPALLPRGGVLG